MRPIRVAAIAAPLAAGIVTIAAMAYPASATTGAQVIRIKTAHKAPYGTILTTSSGRSLYLFSRDTTGHSHCTVGCAAYWPPLIVPKGDTVSGVAGLGIITRPNGKHQAALHGKPLYRYSGDSAPGQVNGQGFDDSWYVATLNGPSHPTSSPTPTASPTPSQSAEPTMSPTPSQTAEPTPTASPTPSQSSEPTPPVYPTASQSSQPTPTPTPTPSQSSPPPPYGY